MGNLGDRRHLLENKWVVAPFFAGVGLPVPETLGLYYPTLGMTFDGVPLCCPGALGAVLDRQRPMVQVHSDGYLTPAEREELSRLGAEFPERFPTLWSALPRILRKFLAQPRQRLNSILFQK